jgi:hypothetical protein
MYVLKISQKKLLSRDISSQKPLIFRTFGPSGHFVLPDVLSLRTFFSTDVMSPADMSADVFFSGRFDPPDVLSPDVLSGHSVHTCLHNDAFRVSLLVKTVQAVCQQQYSLPSV